MEQTLFKPRHRSQSFEDGKKDTRLDRIVRDYIPDHGNINVCDYGCGSGAFLGALSNHSEKKIGKYLGVDVDPMAIEETNIHLKDNQQILLDAHVYKPDDLDMRRYGG
jgi:ribosomal protein L11 methylase PrmA